MLKRTLSATLLAGAMLVAAPTAAFADGHHGDRDGRRTEHHDGDRDRDHRGDRDRDHDRDDYYRHHGYDDGYYSYYGYRCDGYRDGYYYGRDGHRYSEYRRNADCDDYYNRNGRYYGPGYCDAYDYRTGYCG
jgi:Ni/Co efflux regulator RcnB